MSALHCGAAEAEFTPAPGLTLLGQMHERIAKYKRDPLTADCVLMYAQRGSGKRSSYGPLIGLDPERLG